MRYRSISLLGQPTLVLILATFGLMIIGCPAGPNDPPPPQPLDTDSDGVFDEDDDCPDTPAGVQVDAAGCPVEDADADGVVDADDECPDTPAGVAVDATGCPPGDPDQDADDDGVPDADDDCSDTSAGASVDDKGCAADQRDTDGDGVFDDADQCADTPATVNVDDLGCPKSVPGTPDTDGDGVPDDIDQCDDTPVAATADPNGCAASQLDSDGDLVTNDLDQCSETADGSEVDDVGCAADQRDSDGDDVTDDADECADTPSGTTVATNGCPDSDGDTIPDNVDLCANTPSGDAVDRTGCPIPPGGIGGGGGSPGAVCGDEVVDTDAGEQCDPPDGDSCDANCQETTAGGLTNDSCDSPIDIGEGTRSFSNEEATTDGPNEPEDCDFSGDSQVGSDIWYCYTSTCSGVVIASLCGSLYDTKLAVYEGCGCPQPETLACSDDDCSGTESRVTVSATEGASYAIRIGGFEGAQGSGTLTIFCDTDPNHGLNACGAGSGDCLSGNGTPGCEDSALCTTICTADPFCCDTHWDELCAEKADGVVNGFPACEAGTGSCASSDPLTPGCEDTGCCQSVCEVDPFCCLTEWDGVCVSEAESICGLFAACEGAPGGCFDEHPTPGCNVESCCSVVCAADPACCDNEWDDVCRERAANTCGR